MDTLSTLQHKYCTLECHQDATKCPIVVEYNGFYCPFCNGKVIEVGKNKKGESYIKDFSGGFIIVIREDFCQFCFACKCKLGQKRKDNERIIAFDFHDDNRCYVKRNMDRLAFKQRILQKKYPDDYKGIEDGKGDMGNYVEMLKKNFNGKEEV